MSVRTLDRVSFQDIRQTAEVPTVSKESQQLLSHEVFSQQTYWVRRAYTDACSIADKARNIQELSKTVDPNGNELVAHDRAIAITLNLIACALKFTFPILSFVYINPVFGTATLLIYAIFISTFYEVIRENVNTVRRRTNSMHLTHEWQNITHQKESWNNICMGVIDLPSYIKNDEPSLQEAKREFIQVYQWIRE